MLPVLYTDEYITAINKPCGMLVHRTSIANDNDPVALQLLRELTGRMVFPVHRIDRPTSGIVLFAHSPEVARLLQNQLASKECHKQYTALVRGWINEPLTWDREVKNDRGRLKEAYTQFVPVAKFELNCTTDRYPTARYTMVDAFPSTGRWHQIRQHLAQMRHYLINDRVHGDGKQNAIFTRELEIREMFLHARKMYINHPFTGIQVEIEAPFPEHWLRFQRLLEEKCMGDEIVSMAL